MRDIISPWGLFNNSFLFTVSLPLPLPFPLSVLSRLPFPLPIHCSLPCPAPVLTALRLLLTPEVVIVIVIPRTARCSARRSGIRLVLILIILVDNLNRIQWSNGQEVAWLVLPAAWRLNLCNEIISTVPRERIAGAFNLSRAVCVRIGANHLIPDGKRVVPPPIVLLVAGLVKHLPHL